MKAQDMFLDTARNAGAINQKIAKQDRRHEDILTKISAMRAGLPWFSMEGAKGEEPPRPDLGHCPPEIVEEFAARAGVATSPGGDVRFDDLVSPLSAPDFFASQYPNPRPMLFRGPSGRFGHFVEWADLDELVCTGRLSVDDISLVMDGSSFPKELCAMTPTGDGGRQRESGAIMIDDRKLLPFLSQGATLIVDRAQRFLRSVDALARAFEAATHYYSSVNLYASWQSTRGFATHWDSHDVFVVQVRGEKEWHIYGPTRDAPTRVDTAPNRPTPKTMLWKGDLRAGDVFYIPRGWWHDARVTPAQEGRGSVHLTCHIRTMTGRDVLGWLGDKLQEHTLFRRNVPLMAAESQLAQYLGDLKSLIESELRERTAQELKDDYRNRWTEAPGTRFGQWIEPWNSPDWERYRLTLRGFDHATLRHAGNGGGDNSLRLTANGSTHTLDPRCLALIRPLAESREVAVGALKVVDRDSFDAGFVDDFLRTLIRRNIVGAVPPDA